MMEFSPETLNDLCDLMCGEPEKDTDDDLTREELLYKYGSVALSESCVKKLIDMGFCTAPASTKYHGNYAGGLFDHSINVALTLQKITERMGLCWCDAWSPIRIGLLHDLCKVDTYIWNPEERVYTYNNNTLLTDHGIKSVVIAQQLPDIKLTQEEIACITYHMGAFVDSKQWSAYTNAIHKYPNVLWTHTADCFAAHVMEVN